MSEGHANQDLVNPILIEKGVFFFCDSFSEPAFFLSDPECLVAYEPEPARFVTDNKAKDARTYFASSETLLPWDIALSKTCRDIIREHRVSLGKLKWRISREDI